MFKDRQEAGRLLAEKLKNFKAGEAVVLGLARGGVVTAAEIAKALKASLDVLVVKKIGAPGNPELAIGAVGPPATPARSAGGRGPKKTVFWNEELCRSFGVDEVYRRKALWVKSSEQKEKEKALRGGRSVVSLKGKIAILVDDGIATGATVEAAITWIRKQKPKKLVLAVPVAPPDTVEKFKTKVDGLICLQIEPDFWAVGQFYKEFPQVEDEQVIKILNSK